jgi:hypothetical protein
MAPAVMKFVNDRSQMLTGRHIGRQAACDSRHDCWSRSLPTAKDVTTHVLALIDRCSKMLKTAELKVDLVNALVIRIREVGRTRLIPSA